MNVSTLVNSVELDTRKGDGITVELSYNRAENQAQVHVSTPSEDFILYPPNHLALDCYRHPYAYADTLITTGRFERLS